jgi:hypothetical protein
MLDELVRFMKEEEGKTTEMYSILIISLTTAIFMFFMIGIKIGQSLRAFYNYLSLSP